MSAVTRRQLGDCGEEFAAAYLREQGYTILARNYYASHNEIDIIARCGAYICFIEVKTRREHEAAQYGRPAAAVGWSKQQRLIAAAEHYLRQYKPVGQPRLDVIEVYLPDGVDLPARALRIRHLPGAFHK